MMSRAERSGFFGGNVNAAFVDAESWHGVGENRPCPVGCCRAALNTLTEIKMAGQRDSCNDVMESRHYLIYIIASVAFDG
jgi:hypothetical protein